MAWVSFQHHPEYNARLDGGQLEWDDDALNALPENGNVAKDLPVVFEDEDEGSSGESAAPGNTSTGNGEKQSNNDGMDGSESVQSNPASGMGVVSLRRCDSLYSDDTHTI